MFIIDNIVDLATQEHIKKVMGSPAFAWRLCADIVSKPENVSQRLARPGMGHEFIDEGRVLDNHYSLIEPLILAGSYELAEATGWRAQNVLQARSFLQFPLADRIIGDDRIDQFHVDDSAPHWVLLYYVINSDGCTVMSDREFSRETGTIPDLPNSAYNVVERIEPRQGRMVIFDGKFYHSAEQPRFNNRCIININLTQ